MPPGPGAPFSPLYHWLAPPANRQTMTAMQPSSVTADVPDAIASSDSAAASADETTSPIRAPLERRIAKTASTMAMMHQTMKAPNTTNSTDTTSLGSMSPRLSDWRRISSTTSSRATARAAMPSTSSTSTRPLSTSVITPATVTVVGRLSGSR